MQSKILYLIIIILVLMACSDKSIKVGNVVISQKNDTLLISENQQVLKIRNILSYDTMQTCRDLSNYNKYGKKVERMYHSINNFLKSKNTQKVFEKSLVVMNKNFTTQNITYFSDIRRDSLLTMLNHWKCENWNWILLNPNNSEPTKIISSNNYVIYQTYYSDCNCYKFRFFNRLNYAMQTW